MAKRVTHTATCMLLESPVPPPQAPLGDCNASRATLESRLSPGSLLPQGACWSICLEKQVVMNP